MGEAARNFTAEAHEVAKANVGKAAAKVDTIRAQIDQRRIAGSAFRCARI